MYLIFDIILFIEETRFLFGSNRQNIHEKSTEMRETVHVPQT